MKNLVDTNIIVAAVFRLSKEFPEQPIGTHISMALDGRELYTVTDKELGEALMDYMTNLEIEDG